MKFDKCGLANEHLENQIVDLNGERKGFQDNNQMLIEMQVQVESKQRQLERKEAEVNKVQEEKLELSQKYGEIKVQLDDANRLRLMLQKQQDYLMQEMKQDMENYEKKLKHKDEVYDKLEKSVSHRINSLNNLSDDHQIKLNQTIDQLR